MAQFNSNDKLDIAGDWTFNLRVNLDANFTFPPLYTSTYRMHLDNAGKGSRWRPEIQGEVRGPRDRGLGIHRRDLLRQARRTPGSRVGVRKAEQSCGFSAGRT